MDDQVRGNWRSFASPIVLTAIVVGSASGFAFP